MRVRLNWLTSWRGQNKRHHLKVTVLDTFDLRGTVFFCHQHKLECSPITTHSSLM